MTTLVGIGCAYGKQQQAQEEGSAPEEDRPTHVGLMGQVSAQCWSSIPSIQPRRGEESGVGTVNPGIGVKPEKVTLWYQDAAGGLHPQPVTDVVEVGTLIDPDTGDDMQIIWVEVR